MITIKTENGQEESVRRDKIQEIVTKHQGTYDFKADGARGAWNAIFEDSAANTEITSITEKGWTNTFAMK